MTNLAEIMRRWRLQGMQLNPGASDSELALLESLIGVALPQEVRDYFGAMNGMAEGESTDLMTSFWPIERIVGDPQLNAGNDELGEFRDIAFADGMLDAWFIWLRVRGSAVTVFIDMAGLELPSLEALFDRYLTDPATLCA